GAGVGRGGADRAHRCRAGGSGHSARERAMNAPYEDDAAYEPGPERTFAALPPARGGGFARTWWGQAWLKALEDTALDGQQVKLGRRHARAGAVGAVSVRPGRITAVVQDRDHTRPRSDVLLQQFSAAEASGSCWRRCRTAARRGPRRRRPRRHRPTGPYRPTGVFRPPRRTRRATFCRRCPPRHRPSRPRVPRPYSAAAPRPRPGWT